MQPTRTKYTYVIATQLPADIGTLDSYARRGVSLSRDAAHTVMASLRRDADAMRERGGQPNMSAADECAAIANNISAALR